MTKEKKYTKTIAMRITEDEYAALVARVQADGHKNPTELVRAWIPTIIGKSVNA